MTVYKSGLGWKTLPPLSKAGTRPQSEDSKGRLEERTLKVEQGEIETEEEGLMD